jgi:hypothetical protein
VLVDRCVLHRFGVGGSTIVPDVRHLLDVNRVLHTHGAIHACVASSGGRDMLHSLREGMK